MRLKLTQGYSFKRAIDCNVSELESVLDYHAPATEQKGYWPVPTHTPDPVSLYQACQETLLQIDPDTKLTIAQYIRRALSCEEEDSSKLIEITDSLVRYLDRK